MAVKVVLGGFHDVEPLELGPFDAIRFDDCSVFVVGAPTSLAEWAWDEDHAAGWSVESPYAEPGELYPEIRVESVSDESETP